MYIYVPILSPYLSSSNYSLQFIGIVLASYGFIQLLFRLPIGIWSDFTQKRKPFILLGMVCSVLSCLLFLIPNGWIWPVLARAVAGICASTWVAFTIMYSSRFERKDVPKAMGQISLYTVTGQFLGMIVSGWLSEATHYSNTFVYGAIIGVFGCLLAIFLYEKPVIKTNDTPSQGMSFKLVRSALSSKTLITASILSMLAHGVLFITMFGFTPLKAVELGSSGLQLTILIACFMIPHALAAKASHVMLRIFNYSGTFTIAFIASGLCTLAIAFIESLPLLYVTQMINGFAQGLHLPLFLAYAIREASKQTQATAMGLYQAVYSIGMFSGPFIAGILNEHFNLDSGFIFGSILALLAICYIGWMQMFEARKSNRRKRGQIL